MSELYRTKNQMTELSKELENAKKPFQLVGDRGQVDMKMFNDVRFFCMFYQFFLQKQTY